MHITNLNQIPEPIYRAICQNWYSGENANHFISATGLLKPIKMLILEKRHYLEISEEASDLVWSLMGSAMHKVLEKSETTSSLNEERLYAEINGKRISGGIDLYENETISDFKFTSVYSYIYGKQKQEWEQQLNIYSYLYQQAGFAVKKLQIIAVFRDWSRSKHCYEHNYPNQIEVIPMKQWPLAEVEEFISERLHQIKLAMQLHDDAIPCCNKEERWQDATTYAVMKQGNKRALRVFDTPAQAELFISFHQDKKILSAEPRESIPKRCLDYCRVNQFCHFYQQYLHQQQQAG
jgi:uncharacterized protein (DUF1810 family)